MDSQNFSVTSLVIVAGLAVVVPLVLSRITWIRIPIVVGEIIVGVVVGKSGFHLIQPSEWLNFLQFFGLAYLMFVSGLEIDFRVFVPSSVRTDSRLRKYLGSAPVFAALSAAITFLLSYALSMYLHSENLVKSPLLLALIITTTSLTVVVPVLKEYELLTNDYGQFILAAAMFADFVTMLLISVAASLYKGTFSPNVLLVFVLVMVLAILYVIFRRFQSHHWFENLAHGTAQLGIRASLALMVVFIVLSQSFGIQVILGTFLAGIFVGLVNERERSNVYEKLDAIGFGFLIPIFFIMIGVNFNFQALLHDRKALLLLPVLLVATYVFKALPALLLKLKFGWRDTLAGAVLLTTQMSVTVAAAEVGTKIGAISPGVDTAIVLVAMVTSIASPVLFGKIATVSEANTRETCVIALGTPESNVLTEHLRQSEELVYPLDVDVAQALIASGKSTFAERAIQAKQVLAERAKVFVAYTENDSLNVRLCKLAYKFGVPSIICVIRDTERYRRLREQSEFHLVHPQLSQVQMVEHLIRFPVPEHLMQGVGTNTYMEAITIHNRKFHGRRIRDIHLPPGLLLLSITRDGSHHIPHGDTVVKLGDTVYVMGSKDDVRQFNSLTRQNRRTIVRKQRAKRS